MLFWILEVEIVLIGLWQKPIRSDTRWVPNGSNRDRIQCKFKSWRCESGRWDGYIGHPTPRLKDMRIASKKSSWPRESKVPWQGQNQKLAPGIRVACVWADLCKANIRHLVNTNRYKALAAKASAAPCNSTASRQSEQHQEPHLPQAVVTRGPGPKAFTSTTAAHHSTTSRRLEVGSTRVTKNYDVVKHGFKHGFIVIGLDPYIATQWKH